MAGLITRITIDVHHDRMDEEENKLFDIFVSEAGLRTPGMGAQGTVMEALQTGKAEVKLEVVRT